MMEFNYPEGATPLDPNEIEGLVPTNITTKAELDRWEQENINESLAWLERRKPKNILNESFMKQLHKHMFGNGQESLDKAIRTLAFPGIRFLSD